VPRSTIAAELSSGSGRDGSVVVSHPAHQHAYETAVGAQRSGLLKCFVTGLYDRGWGERLARYLPASAGRVVDRELGRRRHPALDPAKVLTLPRHAAVAVAFRRTLGRRFPSRSEQLETWAQTRFDLRVGAWLARADPPRIVHAFEGAALATFQAAKQASVTTVLDVASAHEEYLEILRTEEREPTPYSLDRVREERRLADFLFAPSAYVVACLVKNGVSRKRIVMIPYGADEATFARVDQRCDGTFRVLFVGQIGARKGVKYLLEAWRRLDLQRAELILVGQPDAFGQRLLNDRPQSCRWVGAVPTHAVHEWFQHSDAFVLPTLAEGSALVVFEAMASSLPVITTAQCGAVVRDGRDGFIVPARSIGALEEKLRQLYADRHLSREMGSSGRALVEERYTWRHYHSRIAAAYRLILRGEHPRNIEQADTQGQ
jgi:glycosyltransferase involved in cell wall biosynthesis